MSIVELSAEHEVAAICVPPDMVKRVYELFVLAKTPLMSDTSLGNVEVRRAASSARFNVMYGKLAEVALGMQIIAAEGVIPWRPGAGFDLALRSPDLPQVIAEAYRLQRDEEIVFAEEYERVYGSPAPANLTVYSQRGTYDLGHDLVSSGLTAEVKAASSRKARLALVEYSSPQRYQNTGDHPDNFVFAKVTPDCPDLAEMPTGYEGGCSANEGNAQELTAMVLEHGARVQVAGWLSRDDVYRITDDGRIIAGYSCEVAHKGKRLVGSPLVQDNLYCAYSDLNHDLRWLHLEVTS